MCTNETATGHHREVLWAFVPRLSLMRFLGLNLLLGMLWLTVGCGGGSDTTEKPCGGECPAGFECIDNKFCTKSCESGESRCGTRCVKLDSDKANCGTCDTACKDSETCQSGKCEEIPSCKTGETLCGTSCINLQEDSAHCGSCGNVCVSGKACRKGSCEVSCSSGQALCDGSCTEIETNDAHCGKCNNACSTGRTCSDSQCICSGGTTECGGACVDTDLNDAHCGACNNPCPEGKSCSGGTCVCPSGKTDCNGRCVDLTSDRQSCGACGTICNSNESCNNSKCEVTSCPTGKTVCEGACVVLDSDAKNCGKCGNQCENNRVCLSGKCECPAGKTLCGTECVDVQSSQTHCGACANVCATGELCTGGKCGCPAGQIKCDGACVVLTSSSEHCGTCGNKCSTDKVCNKGVCGCPTGKTLCNGVCLDLTTDINNCGRCSLTCSGSNICIAGKCGCPSTHKVCNNRCLAILIDKDNCGACGNVCPNNQICSAGACGCPSGKTLCGGTCVDLQTDKNNCGQCGTSCPNDQTCGGGKCSCQTNNTCNSLCVDLNTNESHCGQCGQACSTGEVCMNKICRKPWAARFNGTASAMAVDSSGNVYVGGDDSSTSYSLSKFDSQGKVQWTKMNKSASYSKIEGVVENSGNVYVAGQYGDTLFLSSSISLPKAVNIDLFVAKVSSGGVWTWAKAFRSTDRKYIDHMSTDASGNLYIVGRFTKQLALGTTTLVDSSISSFVAKLSNTDGSVLWAKKLSSNATGEQVHIDPKGNFYVVGSFSGTLNIDGLLASAGQGAKYNGFAVKFNDSGTVQWLFSAAGSNTIRIDGIASNSNEDVYLTGVFSGGLIYGTSSSDLAISKGGSDVFVAKLDKTRAVQWFKTMGGSGDDGGVKVALDSSGNPLVAGYFSSTATFGSSSVTSKGGKDLFVSLLDNKGVVQWVQPGGSPDDDLPTALRMLGNDFFLTGTTKGDMTFGSIKLPFSSGDGATTKNFTLKNLP